MSPIARVRRCASQKIASGDGARLHIVMRCLQKYAKNILKPNFRVCGVHFSGFRRRKRGNFSRKNLQIMRGRRCARHPITLAHLILVRCVSQCAKTCLQSIFCVFSVDFSHFWRRKRCNFLRKIRRSRAFGVAHPKKSHLETALVFVSSCAVFKNAQ